MAGYSGPDIVRSELEFVLDASNPKSYVSGSTMWFDLSGNNHHATLVNPSPFNSSGYFELEGTDDYFAFDPITNSSECTCIFWMKTTDTQALFWCKTNTGGGGYYLGAYRLSNKFYSNSLGTPTFHMDGEQKDNIYDYLPDGNWHMVEFKSVNFSGWNFPWYFNSYYSSYTFSNTNLAIMAIYNRNLTTQESLQNYNALKGRFGL